MHCRQFRENSFRSRPIITGIKNTAPKKENPPAETPFFKTSEKFSTTYSSLQPTNPKTITKTVKVIALKLLSPYIFLLCTVSHSIAAKPKNIASQYVCMVMPKKYILDNISHVSFNSSASTQAAKAPLFVITTLLVMSVSSIKDFLLDQAICFVPFALT